MDQQVTAVHVPSQWAAERETAVQWQAPRNYFFHYFDISFFLTTKKVNAGHGRTKCDCHLQASSALFRSLSGSASSQSRMVLISFPLSQSSSSSWADRRTVGQTGGWGDGGTDGGMEGGVTVRYDCVYLQPLSPLDRTTSQWRPVGFRPMTPITFSLTYCLGKTRGVQAPSVWSMALVKRAAPGLRSNHSNSCL